jgi:hypothetical protein
VVAQVAEKLGPMLAQPKLGSTGEFGGCGTVKGRGRDCRQYMPLAASSLTYANLFLLCGIFVLIVDRKEALPPKCVGRQGFLGMSEVSLADRWSSASGLLVAFFFVRAECLLRCTRAGGRAHDLHIVSTPDVLTC